MELEKITWKLFLKHPTQVYPKDFFKVFNSWISDGPEIFIDVVDYSHVPDGPWTLLVGHYVDYALDNEDHKLGFLYSRKRGLQELSNEKKLGHSLEEFLQKVKILLSDSLLQTQLHFDPHQLLLIINDRAQAPNTQETFHNFSPIISKTIENHFKNNPFSLTKEPQPQKRFSVLIKLENSLLD